MALAGNLQDFGLADILQLIFFQRKTGVLTLESQVDTVRLGFVEGNVVTATSKRRPDTARLGRALVQRGLVSEADFQAALEESRGSSERVGKVLFKQGKVSREDLQDVLTEQMTETVIYLFGWKEGHYEFVAQDVVVDRDVGVSLDTEHLLMEGLRVTDEWSLFEGKLELDTVYERLGGSEEGLEDDERLILALVNGRDDVSTLMDTSGLSQLDVAKALVSLSEKGLIIAKVAAEVVQEQAAAPRTGLRGEPLLTFALTLLLAAMTAFVLFQGRGLLPELDRFRQGVGIEELRLRLETYRVRNGRYPDRLAELDALPRGARGLGAVYERTPDGGFRLFAPGPDGVAGTGDDIR